MSAALNGMAPAATPILEVVSEGVQRQAAPAVTVIVTLYNYRDYIAACLDSVKDQTLADLDLVVVDDCSKDDSVNAVRDWLEANGNRFARYRLLKHEANAGLAKARNSAFSQSRTELVFVLDADNLIYPRCLQVLSAALDNCDAAFSYCYLELFGDQVGLHMTNHAWNPNTFQTGNRIDAMAMIRRSAWDRVGGYSTDMVLPGWEDFDLWFKFARHSNWGVLVPEILARYRVHSRSMLRTVTDNDKTHAELWADLRAKYPEFFTGRDAPNPMRLVEEHQREKRQLQEQQTRLVQEAARDKGELQEQQTRLVQEAARDKGELQEQHAKLAQDLARKKRELQEQHTRLIEAEAQDKRALQEAHAKSVRELTREKCEIQEQHASLARELAQVYSSRSYTVTAPLRIAAGKTRWLLSKVRGS